MLQLRPHQSEVVEKLRDGFKEGHRCQLLYAPTGFGKTEVAMAIMKAVAEKFKKCAMVLDRIVLVDQTSRRLDKYGIPHGVMQAGHWRDKPEEHIQVCSAQTLEKRKTFPEIDLLIIDECFAAGTKITTLTGHKDIELVRCGDAVYNQHGIGIVEAISIKPSNDLYRLEFDDGTVTECTANHPHFTEQGWKTTRELEIGSYFFSEQGMRLLWERVETLDKLWGRRKDNIRHAREELEYANYLLQILLKEITESNEQSSKPFKNEGNSQGNQTQTYTAWRERAIVTFATISPTTCAWARVGSRDSNPNEDPERKRLSDLLQAGLSKSRVDDGDRNRRGISHNIGKKSTGQKENRSAYFPRLVSVSHIKRESPEPVYNLQVSGHPSYFANGKLVHNCHITRRGVVKFIQNNPHIRVIGLTATPFTKGLGDIYTHVVGATPTGELIENGWLVPLKVYVAKEIDMTGVTKRAGEWAAEDVTDRGMQIVGDIVHSWHQKVHEVFGKPVKTIVFCAGVEHGRELVQRFAEAGYNFVSISYMEDDQYKKDMIQEFSQLDTQIHGLIATDILTRGFDVTDVLCGVSARPFSKSFSSHVQQMGRVMRSHEGKDFGLWLDHSGNFLRFRDDWDRVFYEGVTELKDGVEKAKKEPTLKEKTEAICPACKVLWTFSGKICGSCGYERKPKPVVSMVNGELLELAQTNKKLVIDNKQFYAELLYYSKQKGYKEGWASHKYKEKFGVFPRSIPKEIAPPSIQTMKWIQSRRIAYVKGKERVAA